MEYKFFISEIIKNLYKKFDSAFKNMSKNKNNRVTFNKNLLSKDHLFIYLLKKLRYFNFNDTL